LARIEKDGLQADIDRLAGAAFLEHIRAVHADYKRMVQAVFQGPDGATVNMREQMRLLQRAIVMYATAMSGIVDDDDPESAEMARKALHPIVTMRMHNARRANRSGGGEEEGQPDAADAPLSDDDDELDDIPTDGGGSPEAA
jgi:hypothetical protein